eukprot:1161773-Pelagomonas_calceolata.AAC.8
MPRAHCRTINLKISVLLQEIHLIGVEGEGLWFAAAGQVGERVRCDAFFIATMAGIMLAHMHAWFTLRCCKPSCSSSVFGCCWAGGRARALRCHPQHRWREVCVAYHSPAGEGGGSLYGRRCSCAQVAMVMPPNARLLAMYEKGCSAREPASRGHAPPHLPACLKVCCKCLMSDTIWILAGASTCYYPQAIDSCL